MKYSICSMKTAFCRLVVQRRQFEWSLSNRNFEVQTSELDFLGKSYLAQF